MHEVYKDIVRRLRDKHKAFVATSNPNAGKIFKESADAIEELVKEVERLQKKISVQEKEK